MPSVGEALHDSGVFSGRRKVTLRNITLTAKAASDTSFYEL